MVFRKLNRVLKKLGVKIIRVIQISLGWFGSKCYISYLAMLSGCCSFHLPHTAFFWPSRECAGPFHEFQQITPAFLFYTATQEKSLAIAHLGSFSPLLNLLSHLSHEHMPSSSLYVSYLVLNRYSYFRSCKCILPCTALSVECYVTLEERHFCIAPTASARSKRLSSLSLKHLSISFQFYMFLEETGKHSWSVRRVEVDYDKDAT